MSPLSTLQAAPRYQLEDKIATGGYGEVWRATDLLLGRPVAVKRLPPDRAQHTQTLARFRAEAQRAGALCHENIARVYDYVEPVPPEPPFLVMELVDGPSAAQVLAHGPLHPAQAMHVIAGAAAGLQAAHEAGFVHRDIKPANLLLARDGRVKVTDFGVSYAVNSVPMTSSNTLLGTTGYVAPERLTGGGTAAPGDLYALGIVAWECLTGSQPFIGTPIEVVVAHRDQPLPPLPASVPAEVAALVTELTAKDPAGRPASAGEVASRAAALRDRLAGESGVPVFPLAGMVPGPAGAPSVSRGFSTFPSSEVAWFRGALAAANAPAAASAPAGTGREAGAEAEAGSDVQPGAGKPERGPGTTANRRRRAGLAAAAALVLAVTGLVVAHLTATGAPQHRTASPPTRTAPGVSTVQLIEVDASALVGQPVGSAAVRLRQAGLSVHVSWQLSRQRPPGTVLAVSPAGRVAPRTLITLTAARAPGGGGTSQAPPDGSSGLASPVPSGGPSPEAAGAGAGPASTAGNLPSASASGSGQVSTPSASPGPTSSTGKGHGKGKGKGNGNGGGNGNGNG